ncbi:NAD(P)-binding protein [Amniculicola lignicola CBS 123094]|uniref:NAD(P)-binding protein n=1 Tax=Amniculicola lignicola CBS 123094 TaxID=1392246 RepID=A0A6A5WVV5_9PLEO|nr:NAD(P)-binding protein [Amniculicola lignicola CBS 123094]
MAPKVFITGVTGYIGGDVLYALFNKHPEYEYTALIRTQEKADTIKKEYLKLKTIISDLDDSSVLEEAAAQADIVIHTADASDHKGAAEAIAKGLSTHSKTHPGFWLHTGGAGILTWEDSKNDKLGERSDKEYNDWDGVDELTHLPEEAFHRDVDQVVLACGSAPSATVKTAILCPPTIYGRGRGPINTRSRQAYELAKLILTSSSVPIVGAGKARWNNIHIHDLTSVFVLLAEAAVAQNQSPDLWGANGYYLVENGEHVWADLARLMGKKAAELGYIAQPKEMELGKDAAMKQAGFEAVSWGLNSRGKAVRAGKVLGWEAKGKSIEEEVEAILRDEKERLG